LKHQSGAEHRANMRRVDTLDTLGHRRAREERARVPFHQAPIDEPAQSSAKCIFWKPRVEVHRF
jgi:hypothetical protein